MKRKTIFLFLALVLPVCIFLFLKMFGRNEFAVPALYTDTYPEIHENCGIVKLPYYIPDSILAMLPLDKDSLVVIVFGDLSNESLNQIRRIEQEFGQDPVKVMTLNATSQHFSWKDCIFFLKEPFNVVMVDKRGAIRGQYVSSLREEIDRLLTELTIILKKY